MLRLFKDGMIECDSPEELVVVLSAHPMNGSNGIGHDEPSPTVHRRRKRRIKRTSAEKDMEPASINNAKSAQTKSWDAARKEAKRQNRTDVARVRSEMAQGK